MAAHPKELTFKYIFRDDYNPVVVTGAIGGPIPSGGIVANFFFERHPLPTSTTHAVDDEGRLAGQIKATPDDIKTSYIRFIDTGIVMTLEAATELHKWLGDQIKAANNLVATKKAIEARKK